MGRKPQELAGRRVEMMFMRGEKEGVPTGTQGTIVDVDFLGTIHVDWDNGSVMGILPDHDIYKVLKK